ncbi:MAG: hypothetical protein AAF934_12850, partial [Bacteroidota bacterium]
MNVSAFASLLEQSGNNSGEYLHSLHVLLRKYPYFQALRALYLKALQQQDSFKYNTALKHTAVHTTDRSVLLDFIASETFSQYKTAEHITKKNVDISTIEVRAEEFIVETFDKKENEAILNPELFYPKADVSETEKTIDKKQSQAEQPSTLNPNALHSFTRWLEIASLKAVERDSSPVEVPKIKTRQGEKFKRIDKFIAESPKIIPQKETRPSPKLTPAKEVEKADLMTETLAKIYLEQKKFKKAIRAYKILSLKYPEKS